MRVLPTANSALIILAFFISIIRFSLGMTDLDGGWSYATLDDPLIVDAAKFCFQTLVQTAQERDYSFAPRTNPSLHQFKVVQASQQVVAGLNIRLTIMVVEKGTDDVNCLGAFSALIYDHFGDYSITEWGQELSCAEAKTILHESTERENRDTN